MSPVKRPSAVDGLRRAAAVPVAPAEAEIRNAVSDLPAAVAAVPPSQRPKPPKPTRFTLDLDAARHQFLKNYAAEIEAKGAADVLRALLDELQADPELAARVRTRVWQQELQHLSTALQRAVLHHRRAALVVSGIGRGSWRVARGRTQRTTPTILEGRPR